MKKNTHAPLLKLSAIGTSLFVMGVAQASDVDTSYTVNEGDSKTESITISGGQSLDQGILVNGTISVENGDFGIVVSGSGAKVEPTSGYGITIGKTGTVNDSIDIKASGSVSGAQGGILNEGTILAKSGAHAISIANGASVSSIVSTGTISGSKSGINIQNTSTVTSISLGLGSKTTGASGAGINIGASGSVGAISVAGTLEGTTYGLTNSGTIGQSGATTPALRIESGAQVSGGSEGIYNQGTLYGGLTIESGATVSSVVNSGSGQIVAPENGATLTNAGTITGGILLGANNNLNTSIVNTGSIGARGITYAGSGALTITNTGRATGGVTANAASSITIKDWYFHNDDEKLDIKSTAAASEESTSNSKVTIEKVTIAGSDTVAKAIADQSAIDLTSKVLVNGSGSAVESAGLSSDLEKMGFKGSFEAESSKLNVFFLANNTAGALLAQSLANASARRDYFVNTMIDAQVRSAQYHYGQGSDRSLFVKPYASRTTLNADAAQLTGSTVGVLLGGQYVNTDGGVTAYAGYEKTDLDSDTSYANGQLGLQSDTFYAGAAAYATIGQVGDIDVWSKLGANIAYSQNDVSRQLSASSTSASAHALSVNAAITLGMNWKPVQSALVTPSVSVGYGSTKIDSFTLENDASSENYQLDNLKLPYADVNVVWQQGWSDTVRTNVGAGVRVLFDKQQTLTSTFGATSLTDNFDLSSSYEYVSAGMTVALNKQNEVSLGYTGVFDNQGQSHNVTAKYEFLF